MEAKFHCRVHKGMPLKSILEQQYPVHTTVSYLVKCHFNVSISPIRKRL
jgi:hypothetical protein